MKLTKYIDIEGSYGGRQLWWGRQTVGNYFGCGVIAALDGYLYRTGRAVSRDDYMAMADELWYEIRPNTGWSFYGPKEVLNAFKGIGVYSPSMFRRGLRRFGGHRGWQFDFTNYSNLCLPWKRQANLNRALKMIREALDRDIQVHMLSHRKQVHGLSFHWITITGMDETPEGHRITVATWGSKRVYDSFEELWFGNDFLTWRFLQFYTMSKK